MKKILSLMLLLISLSMLTLAQDNVPKKCLGEEQGLIASKNEVNKFEPDYVSYMQSPFGKKFLLVGMQNNLSKPFLIMGLIKKASSEDWENYIFYSYWQIKPGCVKERTNAISAVKKANAKEEAEFLEGKKPQ